MPTLALKFGNIRTDPDTKKKYKTIELHQEIIKNKGYVWWGWWNRGDIEKIPPLLEKYAANREAFDIYLVNYVDKRVYLASCGTADVTQPPIRITAKRTLSPQVDCTPEYYRDAGLYVWFRLQSISTGPTSLDTLAHDWHPVNREPDGTIWELYEGHDDEPKEQQLTPVTAEPKGQLILHLSDLHFGNEHGWGQRPTLRSALVRDLDRLGAADRIGVVIISGDHGWKGEISEDLRDLVWGLSEQFRIGKENFVLVPGNHDIYWTGSAKQYVYGTARDNYVKAYHAIFGEDPPSKLCQLHYFVYKDLTLRIAALNSCDRNDAGATVYGRIGPENSGPLFSKIARDTRSDTERSVNMAVLHHHLVPVLYDIEVADDEEAPVSVTLDAEAQIKAMLQSGIKVALHGHGHVPFIGREARVYDEQRLEDDDKIREDNYLYVIGCGSTGARKERCQEGTNLYNLYSLTDDGHLQIEIRYLRRDSSRVLYRTGPTAFPVTTE